MTETDMTKVFMVSENENKEKQSSIVVPIDEDMDTVEVNMNDLEKYVAVKTGHEDVFKKYDPAYNEDAEISYLIHTTDFDLARAKKFACSVAERLFATDVIDRTRDDYDGYDDRKRKTTANFKFKIGSK